MTASAIIGLTRTRSERSITRSEVIVPARVVGGIQLLDRGEADDKIIAVLEGDLMWSSVSDLSDLPRILVERLTETAASIVRRIP